MRYSNRCGLLLLLLLNTVVTFGQKTKADSVKFFFLLESDTVSSEPDWVAFTGKFTKIRRQYYTLRDIKINYRLDTSRSKINLQYDTSYNQVILDYPLIKGYFNNGIKTGKWDFIYDYGTDYSWCTQLYSDYTITYKQDSVIKEIFRPNFVLRHFTIKDDLYVYGNIELENNQKINFRCKKVKNQCYFWLNNSLFDITDYKSLDLVVKQIESGQYSRNFRFK